MTPGKYNTGNLQGKYDNMRGHLRRLPRMRSLLIERENYTVLRCGIEKGKCPERRSAIADKKGCLLIPAGAGASLLQQYRVYSIMDDIQDVFGLNELCRWGREVTSGEISRRPPPLCYKLQRQKIHCARNRTVPGL